MRRRFWLGITAAALVAIGSVVAAVLVYHNDDNDFHAMQREEAMRAAHQTEAVAGLSVDQLDSAAAFFKAEDDLSKHEFEVYGHSLLQQGALSGTAFIPRVTDAHRQRFERTHNLHILDRVGAFSFDRAKSRPEYFPITYVTAEGDEQDKRSAALGYDLGHDPFRSRYLFRARDRGSAVTSPVIPLLVGGNGINVYRPVYRDRAPIATVAQRRRALIGFAAGSFRTEDLAGTAAEAVTPSVQVQLRAGEETVFGSKDRLDDGASAPVRIADRTWLLVVKDPGGPGLSLPIALAVLGISLGALLASLILTWGRTERMQELERQASQDSLTGLGNRRRFEEDLGAAMARSRRDGSRGALLVLDLDRFKQVNDSHGHPAGDRLIKEIAAVLRHRTRESDSLARLGGDEFAVVLPRCSREEARLAAEAIADEVRAHDSEVTSEPVTVSVGISMFGDDPRTSVATLVSEADAAMYAAKDEGRDTVRIFDPVAVRKDAPGQG